MHLTHSRGRQTTALQFIVNRPADEPGFPLERQENHDRMLRYTLHPYAAEQLQGVPGAPHGTAPVRQRPQHPQRRRSRSACATPSGCGRRRPRRASS